MAEIKDGEDRDAAGVAFDQPLDPNQLPRHLSKRHRRLLLPTVMRYQILDGRLKCTPTESMSEQGRWRGHVHSSRVGGNFVKRNPEEYCDKLRREFEVVNRRAEA